MELSVGFHFGVRTASSIPVVRIVRPEYLRNDPKPILCGPCGKESSPVNYHPVVMCPRCR
jgi:uncharacterized CHY-type Zn-finger protein